jgi:DNA helicase-2/ATP-dependent DNA helicase PcrA
VNFTDAQLSAIRVDAPLVSCVAGAGSGKTAVLTQRVIRLLDDGLEPRDILCLTFTRAAATEMRGRLEEHVDSRRLEGLWIGTIHAWCHSLLRRHPETIGRSHDFVVYDEHDLEEVRAGVLADAGISGTWRSATSTRSTKPRERAKIAARAAMLEAEVERRLRSWDAMTFGSLIDGAIQTLSAEPGTIRGTRPRHVLVDEVQDTAPSLWDVLRLLAPEVLFAVGDHRQAIYSFLGATAEIPRGARVNLFENFRSRVGIVAVANRVAEDMAGASPPMIATRVEEARVVFACAPDRDLRAEAAAEAIAELSRSRSPREIAVLAREWRSLEPVAVALAARGVPTWMPGGVEDVWSTPGARAVLAVLRAAVNPRDGFAAERIVEERWGRERMIEFRRASRLSGLRFLFDAPETAYALASVGIARDSAPEAAERAEQHFAISANFASSGRHTKVEEAQNFLHAVAAWPSARRGKSVLDLLDWITHRALAERVREGGEAVTLTTIHGAKGLEWPAVVLLDWQPRGDPEEERRVWYVGATRARDELQVHYCGKPSDVLAGVLAGTDESKEVPC